MASHAARGPLQSVMGQWAVIGLGTASLFGNGDFFQSLQRGVSSALLLAAEGAGGAGRTGSSNLGQPIVIQNVPGPSHSTAKFVTTLVQLVIGAGVCWGSYVVFSTCLPEAVKDMLPVTRKCFDKAVSALGKGVINVREVLAEQILGLSRKQDELSDKQDATHEEVLCVKDEVGDMKIELGNIQESIQRCELALAEADKRQTYTARGVRLLVRSVGAIMPTNSIFASELDSFTKSGDDINHSAQSHPSPAPEQRESLLSPHRQQQNQSDNPQQHTPAPYKAAISESIEKSAQQHKPSHSTASADNSAKGSAPESERHAAPLESQLTIDDFNSMLAAMNSKLIAVQN